RKLDSIQLESALSKHASGIYLLAAPKRIEDSELVSDTTVGAILDLMRQLFYVLDQSIGAARCAWRFVDLLGRLGLPRVEPNFILSRFVSGHPISEEQLSHTLAQSIHTRIPRDEKVLERVQLSAQDLWQVAPNSPLAKSIED